MTKAAADLTVFADDKERRKAMDFLADAYATNCIDKAELERREDIVLMPMVRRDELVVAVSGLGADLFPEPKQPDFSPLWWILILLACAGILAVVILA